MPTFSERVHDDSSEPASPYSPNDDSPLSSPSPSAEETNAFAVPPPNVQSAAPPQRPRLPPQAMPPPAAATGMTFSSTPLGNISAARRPGPPQPALSSRGAALPQDLAAKLKAFTVSRQGAPPVAPNPRLGPSPSVSTGPLPPGRTPFATPSPSSPSLGPGGIPSNFRVPNMGARPGPMNMSSSPAVSGPIGGRLSLAKERGMVLPGGLPGAKPAGAAAAAPVKKRPMMKLSQMNGGEGDSAAANSNSSGSSATEGSLLDKYSDFIDKATGNLTFKGKATLTNQGVEFASGKTFSISLNEVDTLDELGKGNYGTVYKVRHSRPRMRRPGQGLAGNKALPSQQALSSAQTDDVPNAVAGTSGVVMAMKEIRLELDDAKFAAIIMELDILHRCVSPFIVDFYGAFFQEGAVYICMEFMDGGSIDKIYGDGIPENVLRKITLSTTMGLKSLKDEHNIIHRDVKPTNILCNTRGQVKICDFGVSGNLVASIAKTNIGCQSYMAPERISSGGVQSAGANPGGGTYSVQSDIWSLGLSIIECALGRYPYPPETYDNIFSQLSAIVDGDPPDLPKDSFSPAAHDFVRGCLMKIPKLRPTYAMLLQHPWLAKLLKPPTISEEDEEAAEAGELPIEGGEVEPLTADKEVAAWVQGALERKRSGKMANAAKPALHAAPLDAVAGPATTKSTA